MVGYLSKLPGKFGLLPYPLPKLLCINVAARLVLITITNNNRFAGSKHIPLSVVSLKNTYMKRKEDNLALGPLLCWDIYMEGYHRTMGLLDSLQKLKKLAKSSNWNVQWDIEKELLTEQKIILVTDVSLLIRFASTNILGMNGYSVEEVIGKSPKMFQGKDTAVQTRAEIRDAIVKEIPYHGSIVNYRKDGTPYNCLLEEYPVWSRRGKLVNFIAFEKVA